MSSSPSPPSPLCPPCVLEFCTVGNLFLQKCMPSVLKPQLFMPWIFFMALPNYGWGGGIIQWIARGARFRATQHPLTQPWRQVTRSFPRCQLSGKPHSKPACAPSAVRSMRGVLRPLVRLASGRFAWRSLPRRGPWPAPDMPTMLPICGPKTGARSEGR